MKSRRAILGQALVAAMAPMLMGAWAAHTIGAETLQSDAAMIAIPTCGYAGIAIFLLARGKLLNIELRLRLLLSIIAISAIPGSMLLIQNAEAIASSVTAWLDPNDSEKSARSARPA